MSDTEQYIKAKERLENEIGLEGNPVIAQAYDVFIQISESMMNKAEENVEAENKTTKE